MATETPRPRSKGMPFFPRLSGLVLRLAARLLARVEVVGVEKVPSEGPALIICNHCSNADGMLLMAYVVPKMGRKLRWLGKEEALRWPVFGWAMKANGVFGVRRGAGDLEAFKAAKGVLDRDDPLAIFPEGTRSPTGQLQAAKEGATVLAVRSGAPLVPIAISGSQRFWPKGKLLPRPRRRMRLEVGDPFTLTMPAGSDRKEAMRAATTELMRHIAEMLPPDQRGVYSDAVRAGSAAPPLEEPAGKDEDERHAQTIVLLMPLAGLLVIGLVVGAIAFPAWSIPFALAAMGVAGSFLYFTNRVFGRVNRNQ